MGTSVYQVRILFVFWALYFCTWYCCCGLINHAPAVRHTVHSLRYSHTWYHRQAIMHSFVLMFSWFDQPLVVRSLCCTLHVCTHLTKTLFSVFVVITRVRQALQATVPHTS